MIKIIATKMSCFHRCGCCRAKMGWTTCFGKSCGAAYIFRHSLNTDHNLWFSTSDDYCKEIYPNWHFRNWMNMNFFYSFENCTCIVTPMVLDLLARTENGTLIGRMLFRFEIWLLVKPIFWDPLLKNNAHVRKSNTMPFAELMGLFAK